MLLITIIHLLLAIKTVTNVIYQIMILKLGELELFWTEEKIEIGVGRNVVTES